MTRQRTLKRAVSLQGVGIHSGTQARLTLEPAPENFGRRFRINGVSIPAQVEYVIDTSRCTTLGFEGAKVSTVEHLLSALYATEVDNALLILEGIEIPILDGSALPFMEAIGEAGIEEQSALAPTLSLKEEVVVQDKSATACAKPDVTYSVTATTEFDAWSEGAASCTFQEGTTDYLAQVAPARTFAFDFEVRQLLAAGLAQGGSLENALIITPPNEFSTPLRIEQEWCWHKVLDIMGDLALLDARLKMSLSAIRTGHRLNVHLAQAILAQTGRTSISNEARRLC